MHKRPRLAVMWAVMVYTGRHRNWPVLFHRTEYDNWTLHNDHWHARAKLFPETVTKLTDSLTKLTDPRLNPWNTCALANRQHTEANRQRAVANRQRAPANRDGAPANQGEPISIASASRQIASASRQGASVPRQIASAPRCR